VVGRRHAEAAKRAGVQLVPLGELRGERTTWAIEFLWIDVATARLRVGAAKKMISAADAHSLVTSGTAGGTWTFGTGTNGQLGHGGRGNEVVPRRVEALNRMVVVQVGAGSFHSMVLTIEGRILTWGAGGNGQLGHGNTDRQLVPKRVEGLTNVMGIAAGGQHSLAVGEDGALYTWGYNDVGQLGRRELVATTLAPTAVPGVNDVVDVAAGDNHSLVLRRDGTMMACGENVVGQLGIGDMGDCDTFTVVLGLWGVVDIDAGSDHSMAATTEGGLYSWGYGPATGHGGNAQLVPARVVGGGIEEAMVVQVAAGGQHSMALTASGELGSWGRGHKGQLGHGVDGVEEQSQHVPRVVGGIGEVVGMGGGSQHSLAITAGGRVLVFGSSNGEEQWEDSDGEELDDPVFVFDGRLGLGAEVGKALAPTLIDGITIGGGEEGAEGRTGNE
jgi:alpha-tubulin suppressor-like RCC1 family protein